ncbi:MAG: substrate-binding domain-containing protein, partial [Lachnoclostridium sp.]|nr:substrate-binding domain-containing protein [Lachnoclostridium sp.]
MFRNNRKTIAVFIFRMTHYFQKTLCKGISEQAYKMGYNVAFFSSFGAYNDNISFSEGEKIIKTLPNYNNYAGIVLALDTMDIEGFKEDLIKECRKLTCPVVCIREESDGFYNFNINEKNSIESVIRHFVEYHKYRDICFLTGRENDISAQQRLACFLRVMEENGIEVDIEKQVRYGNYWKNDGEPACKQFIDEYGRWPEAIICANDYMAISVCNELIERGIRVPEDIAVGGFDGIEETKVYATPITSAGVPSHEMGAESIVLIDRIINGEECE